MTNDIPALQNGPEMLRLQAAAKVLYRRAERLFYLQAFLTAFIPVLLGAAILITAGARLVSHNAIDTAKAWLGLWTITVLLVDDLLIEPVQVELKREAAVFQEMFDVGLFGLEWRRSKIGPPHSVAEAKQLSDRRSAKEEAAQPVTDWYPAAVGTLPVHIARVVCQRAGICWDSSLRRKYAAGLAGLAWSLALGVVVIGLLLGMSTALTLTAAAALAPALRWALRERRRQRTTADQLDRQHIAAKDLCANLLSDTLSEAEATRRARELQDDIFDRRRNSPIGLSSLYGVLRARTEEAMKVDADQFAIEYSRVSAKRNNESN